MIVHVVMFKIREDLDREAVKQEIKTRLDALPAKIDVIRKWEVGLNVVPSPRAYDVVLVSAFESLDALQTYQQHPDHVAQVEYLKSVSSSIVAVDYEGAGG
ncbi:MAG: Dabb family protein [Anaerolineae bacterium]